MPRISILPSSCDSTERSCTPRFCATAATPAVRQLASPTRTYSIGVMPLSSDAKISGWSASNEVCVLCCCSCPRPKKLWTSVLLCVPFCHLQDARHVNCVASGAPFNASRASSSACTFTPLLHVAIAIGHLVVEERIRKGKSRIIHATGADRRAPEGSRGPLREVPLAR